MTCAACGEPADGWPANNGGELCQMCWELECAADWWCLVAESEDWWRRLDSGRPAAETKQAVVDD